MLHRSLILAFAALMTLSLPAFSEAPLKLLGSPAEPAAGQRTIVIKPDTKWVNVTGGETINFAVGDKSFAWNFNGSGTVTMFELNRVAPPGLLKRPVKAYIAPDPKYSRR